MHVLLHPFTHTNLPEHTYIHTHMCTHTRTHSHTLIFNLNFLPEIANPCFCLFLAGALSDSTGNYNAAFYLAGITLALSGIICLPLRRIAKWEFSKQNLASAGQNSGRPVTNSSQVMSDHSKGTDIDIVQ